MTDDLQAFIDEQERTVPGFREAREDTKARHSVLDALLAERKSQRLTQATVAERMEITQPTVSEFESEASDPRLSTLQRYARAVGGQIEVRFISGRPLCPCATCDDERRSKLPWPQSLSRFMIVCEHCGNKRCPHANHHDNACTGSNESGQPGSAYPRISGVAFPPELSQPTEGEHR